MVMGGKVFKKIQKIQKSKNQANRLSRIKMIEDHIEGNEERIKEKSSLKIQKIKNSKFTAVED